ncbi:MAG: 23S rRNA (adenine(2503)-C(2))-methyltransferase RlmN [Planctomycetaceae bacterium]|nr:23S rRNA (adenine(2503)-C(2))-methyltransferase RlmN [Planctomycetales bacterium]MCB9924843.1 23S rRNA (adenine(2503)-C(2))-methyltransferase RlmN [Planctomycetaceae bacterium]
MSTHSSISPFDKRGIEHLRREFKLDPECVRRFRNSLLKRFATDEAALEDFPAADHLHLHELELFRRRDSKIDGATKLLLRTKLGMLIEAVILRIETGRTTLCVSSQVGCAAACEFCATGKMGVARNLSPEEILDQVLRAGQLLAEEGRSLRNIVFMGMGEPFHNEENLYRAIEILISPVFFNIAPTKVLVSTVGITDAMLRCVECFPRVNLALSLHSVRQEVRERLIPLATKFPLDELHRTVAELNRRQASTVMIEYLMLAGVNDSQDDAKELATWLQGLRVHVNLIPYNPIEDASQLVGSDRETRLAFAKTIRDAGFKTTLRYSLGNDIAAACGQLVRRENRGIAKSVSISGVN